MKPNSTPSDRAQPDRLANATPTIFIARTHPRFAMLTWVSISRFSHTGPAAFVLVYSALADVGQMVGFPRRQPYGRSVLLSEGPHPVPQAVFGIFGTDGGGQLVACTCEDRVRGRRSKRSAATTLQRMFGKSGHAAGIVPWCTSY